MTPTDAEIIDRSRHEPDAFAAIFDRHAPHIRRYFERRLGAQVADDLVAETFLAAFDKRQRYDRARPDARPWLYGIATNLVGQHRRHEARRYRDRAPDTAEHDHADRVAAEVTAWAVRSRLAGALDGLSAEDRDVLLLVAAVAVTISLIAFGQAPSDGRAAATPPASAQPVTDAVRLLNHAARIARADPTSPPRPDQFVYQRIEQADGNWRESWLSVDGTRDGVYVDHDGRERDVPGCRDGQAAVLEDFKIVSGATQPCMPNPAYLSRLPTDVDAMVAYMNAAEEGTPVSYSPRMPVWSQGMYVPPLSRAALYEALAREPRLQVVPDARDGAGRRGLGITLSTPGSGSDDLRDRALVFDPDTFELLGFGSYAITAQSFVDQPRQRP